MSALKTYELSNKLGMRVIVLNFGATLIDLQVPDKHGNPISVVVGLKNPEAYTQKTYLDQKLYLGASIGRYAGRIANNSFSLDGTAYRLDSDLPHQLHGGTSGLHAHYWELVDYQPEAHLILKTSSPHLDGGYPGRIKVEVKYRLTDDALEIEYTAQTDRSTALNLTNHAYFNLNGGANLEGATLSIAATKRLETDQDLIPTGNLLDVANTSYDFRGQRSMDESFPSLDDAFVLNGNQPAATIYTPASGITMEVSTNQPAMVVYTPQSLPRLDYLGKQVIGMIPAICFECQGYPDAPNKQQFPSTILEPGATYFNFAAYRFRVDK